MKRIYGPIRVILVCSLLAPIAATSLAGGLTDDLSKCLVKSTTDADRTLLVQWMFAMATLHPAVKSMGTVTAAQRTELNKKIAGIVEHLLMSSCKAEAQLAIKAEGNSAMEASFNVLGQVAGRELFTDPQVAVGSAEFAKYLDVDGIKKTLLTGK